MIRYLLSLTALTAAVLLLRTLFRRHISARLIYAMWLIVLVRMLIPLSLFTVPIPAWESRPTEPLSPSVTVQTEAVTAAIQDTLIPDLPPQNAPQPPAVSDIGEITEPSTPSPLPTTPPTDITNPITVPDAGKIPSAIPTPPTEQSEGLDILSLLCTAWFCGSFVFGVWFLLSACHFQRQLHQNRTYLRTVGRTRVYRTDDPHAPCLTGLPPTIYLSEDTEDKPLSSLVLIHEYTHLRHGDPLWNFCRVAAICVFWWHPLIWLASYTCAQDAELACDEAVSAKLDDDLRMRYAHIILDTVPQKRRTVTGLGSHPIKERILRLADPKRHALLPTVLILLLVMCLLGCSFAALTVVPPKDMTTQPDTETADIADSTDLPQPDGIGIGTSELTWVDRSAIEDAGYTFGGLVLSTRQESTRCKSFPLGTQYRIFVFYDLVRGDGGQTYTHRYVRLLVVDILTGESLYCQQLDTDSAPSDISYLSENMCILYHTVYADQLKNAFLVSVMENEVVVTPYSHQIDEVVKAYLVSPNGSYIITQEADPLTGDGGITVYMDNTQKRILDNFQLEEANAAGLSGDDGLSAVVGYRPVGFLDDTRLVYNMIGYEGTNGWGIYDLAADENTAYHERDSSVIGVHDGHIYAQYGSGYGNDFDRIDRIAPDGTATTLITDERRREEDMYVWNNGTWIQSIYRETPDTTVHTVSSDMTVEYGIAMDTVTLRVLSEDMTKTLLEFDICADLSRFHWQERLLITDDRVTAVLEIEKYPEIPPEETILSAVVTNTAVGTVYVSAAPNRPGQISVYSHNPENGSYYLHYVPVFPDSITPDYLYLYPHILPGDTHDGFRMLCEAELGDTVRYFVLYADQPLSEIGQMLCEREITHEEYIRLRTEAYSSAAYPALVDDTVPLTDLYVRMEELENSGVFDSVQPDYRLTVSGLSVPLRLYMHGDSVFAAEAWGYRQTFTDPLDIYGNCNFDILEVDGTIIVEGGYYGIGDVYTFSKDGTDAMHPGREASYYLYTENGRLRYRLSNNRIADIVQTGALSVARGYDEFLSATGDAAILNGQIALSEPSESYTVSDNYDLDREFDEAWSRYYADIDEAFRTNRINAVLASPHISRNGPYVGYVMNAETPWIQLYTDIGGLYTADIPYDIFRDFPASDRTAPYFTPGLMEGIEFWYGEYGNFRWAFAATGPVMGTSNQNFAYSHDGGKTWTVGSRSDLASGVVLGAGFASDKVGFVSLEDSFTAGDTPTIAHTTDGGKTWQYLSLQAPAAYGIYRFRPLTPIFYGDFGIYPIMLTDRDGSYYNAVGYTYLLSEDGGITWTWGARPIS